jgi:hypothetical protein
VLPGSAAPPQALLQGQGQGGQVQNPGGGWPLSSVESSPDPLLACPPLSLDVARCLVAAHSTGLHELARHVASDRPDRAHVALGLWRDSRGVAHALLEEVALLQARARAVHAQQQARERHWAGLLAAEREGARERELALLLRPGLPGSRRSSHTGAPRLTIGHCSHPTIGGWSK